MPFRLFVFVALLFCARTGAGQAPAPAIWSTSELNAAMQPVSGQLTIFNFWATWCKPCLEELPAFRELHDSVKFQGRNVRIVLVSLDFMAKRDSVLIPFVNAQLPWAEVVQLNAPDANSWIPLVSEYWSGAIPATLFVSENARGLAEKPLTAPELLQIVKDLLPKNE